jgi:membrane associated rhomboid family serine protease
MIPIRDAIPSRNVPVITYALIAVNVCVYFIQLSQGESESLFAITYGIVPARYSDPAIGAYFTPTQQLFSFFSFMFLHGGVWHILGNMWSLYIFGDNVEDHLGPFRYLLFYLLCGIVSGASHILLNLHSRVPTIGASGAIAGVMGAYFILHPRAKILTLIPIIFIPWFVEIPAFFFLGFWFVLQFINAAGDSGGAGGVAWWAHIGGFVFGILLLKLLETIPTTGITRKTRAVTSRRHTSRLQVLRPTAKEDGTNVYDTITISTLESMVGTSKIVNIPYGVSRKLFRVSIPAGIRDGQILRLKGQGRASAGGIRGDLMLKVTIR